MTLRVGFLSGVRHAAGHADLLAADPRVTLVGVAERPEAPEWVRADSRAVARARGLAYADDTAALLADVDLAVVCSEPTRHAALAREAVLAGVPVLVDKPVATSVADVDALAALADERGGWVGVVNRAGAPALAAARDRVRAGDLGEVVHVDAEWLASRVHFAAAVERPELVVDPALAGGGELMNFLLYPVDAIAVVTGQQVASVRCLAGSLFGEPHASAGAEDAAVLELALDGGATATVALGRVAAAPGGVAQEQRMRVYGTRGWAGVDEDAAVVDVATSDGGHEGLPVGGPSAATIVRAVMRDAVSRVLDGRPPAYGLAEARHSLAVVEAAYAAARSGRAEPVSRSRSRA